MGLTPRRELLFWINRLASSKRPADIRLRDEYADRLRYDLPRSVR